MQQMTQDEIRRKHSPVDLQQVVTHLAIYKRPLNSSGGKSGALCGLVHESGVATTTNGKLYMIEKGPLLKPGDEGDDINYPIRYRERATRIVEVTQKDIRDWKLVRSVKELNPGVTEDLFNACGKDYDWLKDNCWNAAQQIRVAANESEDGWRWQSKAKTGGAVALGVVAIILALVFGRKSDQKEKY